MSDTQKTDLLLQYILSVAGQEEWDSQELGMIHLIKYAYLADLAYAKSHNGKTYTGTAWRFHHYGPWSEEVYFRIDPALEAIGAHKRKFYSPKYDQDFLRWSIKSDRVYDELERKIDISIAGTIQKYVHKFGADTIGLLHHVYKTTPMLQAAPQDVLDFSAAIEETEESPEKNIPQETSRTIREQKKRKEKFLELKKRLHNRLDRELHTSKLTPRPPRYDDIYIEGVKRLDELAGEPLKQMECTAIFPDDVWKSKARFDPDVP